MLINFQPIFHFCTPFKSTDVFMGYRTETLAGDGLRKTYTHNNFEVSKFSMTQGLKQILPG